MQSHVFSFALGPKKTIHTPNFSVSCFRLCKTLVLVLNHLLQNNLLAIEEDTELKSFILIHADFNKLFF